MVWACMICAAMSGNGVRTFIMLMLTNNIPRITLYMRVQRPAVCSGAEAGATNQGACGLPAVATTRLTSDATTSACALQNRSSLMDYYLFSFWNFFLRFIQSIYRRFYFVTALGDHALSNPDHTLRTGQGSFFQIGASPVYGCAIPWVDR